MSILKKLDRYTENGIITLFLITMSVFIMAQVISRYVFGSAFTWTEEISRYMFIWMVFLGIGIGFKENKHISIDFVVDLFPPILRKIIKQLNYILLIAISSLFVWEGYVMVLKMQMFGQTSANIELPMWWVYVSLPVGFLLAIIRLVQASISLWVENKSEVEQE